MTIEEIEKDIIEEFDLFEDWMDKYTYLIDLGKKSNPENLKIQKPENLVNGCNSNVWIIAEKKDDKLYFVTDSDALIPKGIAALIVRLYSGHSAGDIFNHKPIFIKEIGLEQNLSPNRANGLVSMLNRIKTFAKNNL